MKTSNDPHHAQDNFLPCNHHIHRITRSSYGSTTLLLAPLAACSQNSRYPALSLLSLYPTQLIKLVMQSTWRSEHLQGKPCLMPTLLFTPAAAAAAKSRRGEMAVHAAVPKKCRDFHVWVRRHPLLMCILTYSGARTLLMSGYLSWGVAREGWVHHKSSRTQGYAGLLQQPTGRALPHTHRSRQTDRQTDTEGEKVRSEVSFLHLILTNYSYMMSMILVLQLWDLGAEIRRLGHWEAAHGSNQLACGCDK